MNHSVVICRIQYQRGPEGGEAVHEDYSRLPMRAAVRIKMAVQPKSFGPFKTARSLFTRALFNLRQKSLSCFRVVFHCSDLLVAPAYEKQLSTGAFRGVRNPFRGHGNA